MYASDRLLNPLLGKTVKVIDIYTDKLVLTLNDGTQLQIKCENETGADSGLYTCAVLRVNGDKAWSD